MIFVDGIDYSANDIQILTWLAKPGTRMSVAGGLEISQSSYVSWPAIRVTILHQKKEKKEKREIKK